MSFKDISEQASQTGIAWLIGALLTAASVMLGKFVRTILTNQQTIHDNQIKNDQDNVALRKEIASREELWLQDSANREKLRKQDREHFNEKFDDLKSTIDATQGDVKQLMQRSGP